MAITPTYPQPQSMMTDGMINVLDFADTIPPVWDNTIGIQTLTVLGDGGLNATWGSATDISNPPVLYVVYIKAGNATDLFTTDYLKEYTTTQTIDIYTLPNNVTELTSGTTYFVGIRAMDKVRNFDTNEISLSAVVSKSNLGGGESILVSDDQKSILITK